MTYRAKCQGRRSHRKAVLYGRLRRSHERLFRQLEAIRPEPRTGDILADMLAEEMYGAAQHIVRSQRIYRWGPRFLTWEERYRRDKDAGQVAP
jgi:hypothetical protein